MTGRADINTPLVQRFLEAHPSADVYPFLGAEGLEELYSKTLLNVHPPSYDAFGMSVVEAAAFGAPTIFQKDADVGSKVVLSLLGDGAFFEADLDDSHAGYIPAEDRPSTPALEAMNEGELKRYKKQYEDGVYEVTQLLRDEKRLSAMGRLAKKRSTCWTEEAHGGRLMDEIIPVLSEGKEAKRQLQLREERTRGKDGRVRMLGYTNARKDRRDAEKRRAQQEARKKRPPL